jgi:hypothetical protein
VASGHDVTSTVRVHNHQDRSEMLATNGQITGRVINPRTGDVVGGFAGFQTMPRITFEIPPHASASVPLLIGTASTTSELGYAVPAGRWSFDAIVDLDSGTYRTAPLPLTVT